MVLNEEMFGGTPQGSGGSSEGGTVGEGIGFRLHHGTGEGEEANALTLVLTWDGENGPFVTPNPKQRAAGREYSDTD